MTTTWMKALACATAVCAVACGGGGSTASGTSSPSTSTTTGTGTNTTPTTPTTPTSGSGGTTPTVDATVATIAVGPYASGLGLQGIALNADRTRLYVGVGTRTTSYANGACQASVPSGPSAQGQVAVIDTSSRAKLTDIPVSVGTPVHVELDAASNRVYVASSPGAVYGISGTSIVASNTSIGGVPHDFGIDPTIGRAIVTNTFNGTQTMMSMVTLPSLTVTGTIESGFGPHKVATDPERHLAYVTHAEFSKVDVVDLQAGTLLRQIDTTVTGGSAQNAIDLARRKLYTIGQTPGAPNSSRMIAIDLATEKVTGTVALTDGSHGSRVDPVTGFVWVLLSDQHAVAVIDPTTLTEKARVGVGHCPFYLDVDPSRRLAYVTNQGDTTITVLDMTRVAGTSTASALARVRALEQQDRPAAGAVVQLSNAIVSELSPVSLPPAHSIRERIAHAQEAYLGGRQLSISDAALADAMNAAAESLWVPAWEPVTAARVHDLRDQRPRSNTAAVAREVAAPFSDEMSPLEAVTVGLSIVDARLAEPGRAPAGWTPVRLSIEQALQDEQGVATRFAHRVLTALGIRR